MISERKIRELLKAEKEKLMELDFSGDEQYSQFRKSKTRYLLLCEILKEKPDKRLLNLNGTMS